MLVLMAAMPHALVDSVMNILALQVGGCARCALLVADN